MRLIDDSKECIFLDNRCEWPIKSCDLRVKDDTAPADARPRRMYSRSDSRISSNMRAARAQQSAMPVVGLLSGSSPEASRRPMAAFQRALADSGFIEGQSVTIDYRWAAGRFDLLPAMAADVVRRPVALIVAFSPPAALAAKAATTTIPIVFHSGGVMDVWEKQIKSGGADQITKPDDRPLGDAVEAKILARRAGRHLA
jgi:ABC transporter substrate binding protein